MMLKSKVAILDYKLGNLRSILNAMEHIGANCKIISEKDEIKQYDSLIIPGVGAFDAGMKNIMELGFYDAIHDFYRRGKPILGICLGFQLLFDTGNENGNTKGLGFVPGSVQRIDKFTESTVRLPHVGWSKIQHSSGEQNPCPVLKGLNGKRQYFVHSYIALPEDEDMISSTTCFNDFHFVSAIRSNNLFGVQFHPEKSGVDGLKLLQQFHELS